MLRVFQNFFQIFTIFLSERKMYHENQLESKTQKSGVLADGYSGSHHVVYTVLGAFGVVPTVSEDTAVNIVTALVSALTTIGVLVDPTTKGIGDSERALGYTEPNEGSAG